MFRSNSFFPWPMENCTGHLWTWSGKALCQNIFKDINFLPQIKQSGRFVPGRCETFLLVMQYPRYWYLCRTSAQSLGTAFTRISSYFFWGKTWDGFSIGRPFQPTITHIAPVSHPYQCWAAMKPQVFSSSFSRSHAVTQKIIPNLPHTLPTLLNKTCATKALENNWWPHPGKRDLQPFESNQRPMQGVFFHHQKEEHPGALRLFSTCAKESAQMTCKLASHHNHKNPLTSRAWMNYVPPLAYSSTPRLKQASSAMHWFLRPHKHYSIGKLSKLKKKSWWNKIPFIIFMIFKSCLSPLQWTFARHVAGLWLAMAPQVDSEAYSFTNRVTLKLGHLAKMESWKKSSEVNKSILQSS